MTRKIGLAAIAALCVAGGASHAGNLLWYDRPAQDSDRGWERESLPIGNGWFGVSVFGGVAGERLQVTENSFLTHWSLTSALDIRLNFPGHDFAKVADYRRELDLDTGLATVSYRQDGVTYRRTCFTSYPDRILAMHLTSSKKGALAFSLRPEIPYQRPFGKGLPERNGRMGSVASVGNAIDIEQHLQCYNVRFFGRLAVDTDGDVANVGGVLSVTNATSATICFSCGTNYRLAPESFAVDGISVSQNRGPAPREAVIARIDAARRKGYDRVLAEHLDDFGGIMRRVTLSLPGGDAEADRAMPTDRLLAECAKGRVSGFLDALYFQYGRYLLASSSRPGTLPANLQGTWCGIEKPSWGSGYWYNINIQMNYWPAFTCNLAECFEPFARFHAAFRPRTKPIVAAYLKRHGLGELPAGPEASDIWCVGTAVYPYVMDGGPGSHSGPGTSGLTTCNFIDWWEFTHDEKALREYVWPAVHGTAAFFLRCVTETNGLYLSKFSASPEQMLPGVEDKWQWGKGKRVTYYHTVGCAFDQSMIWENNHALLAFAEILGTNDAVVAAVRNQIDRYDPIQVGASGQIKEYREEVNYGDYGQRHHRHISQLVGLYPGSLINKNHPDWMSAARVSLDLRGDNATGWGLAHRLNCRARLGDGERAYKLIRILLSRKTHPNMWDVHPPFQIDGNFGATSGIAEMLLQSNAGYVDLLPALPQAWSGKGSFTGLCARNRITVDCAWERGRPVRVAVKAPPGVHPDVRFAGHRVPFEPLNP